MVFFYFYYATADKELPANLVIPHHAFNAIFSDFLNKLKIMRLFSETDIFIQYVTYGCKVSTTSGSQFLRGLNELKVCQT